MRWGSWTLRAAAASAAALLTFGQASAALMLAHYTGVVGSETRAGATYDTTDYFGLGDSLVGARFEATFRYDTQRGFALTNASTDTRYGGPDWSGAFTSPILEAFLTINGVTETFDVSRNGSANVTVNDAGWRQTFFYVDSYLYPFENALQLWVLNTPVPLRLDQPYSGGNVTGLDRPTTDPFAYGFVEGGKNFYLALAPETVTLSRVAVPEPATWALLIAGFGLTGAVLRRRAGRRVAVA